MSSLSQTDMWNQSSRFVKSFHLACGANRTELSSDGSDPPQQEALEKQFVTEMLTWQPSASVWSIPTDFTAKAGETWSVSRFHPELRGWGPAGSVGWCLRLSARSHLTFFAQGNVLLLVRRSRSDLFQKKKVNKSVDDILVFCSRSNFRAGIWPHFSAPTFCFHCRFCQRKRFVLFFHCWGVNNVTCSGMFHMVISIASANNARSLGFRWSLKFQEDKQGSSFSATRFMIRTTRRIYLKIPLKWCSRW